MKIAYYMPFKPLGHKNPSGDLIIGTELFEFLQKSGQDIFLISQFRCRWIYLKLHLWPLLLWEIAKVIRVLSKTQPDIWLTYHSYYKAPDIVGPICCRLMGIPYVIFQGVYSTKRRRALKTKAGFYLNRVALLRAACVFTNKKVDEKNLLRLLPEEKVHYIAPGIHPLEFCHNEAVRRKIRQQIGCQDRVVIMSTAMFRPGVKTKGMAQVIEACGKLKKRGRNILLMIAGDGSCRHQLERLADMELSSDVIFLGRLERKFLSQYYSAADIFAFPGIEESLGLVYLEAQACGLPVIAHGNWGASEAVVHQETGLLSAADEVDSFVGHLDLLAQDADTRGTMGAKATRHVRSVHDLHINYRKLIEILHHVQM